MDARPEVGHQVAERAGLPPFVQRLERLGDAVGGRRDLIGVDGVQFLSFPRHFQVPEDQRPAADDAVTADGVSGRRGRSLKGLEACAGLETCRPNRVHHLYGNRRFTLVPGPIRF